MSFPTPILPTGQEIQAQSSTTEAFRFYVLWYLSRMANSLTPSEDGSTYGSVLSTTGLNKTVIKAGPGKLTHLDGSSVAAEEVYIKVYDKATVPNEASDVPVYRYLIPGRTTGAGTNPPFPASGINFVNGISFLITSGPANNDSTGVTANQIIVNYGSK